MTGSCNLKIYWCFSLLLLMDAKPKVEEYVLQENEAES